MHQATLQATTGTITLMYHFIIVTTPGGHLDTLNKVIGLQVIKYFPEVSVYW